MKIKLKDGTELSGVTTLRLDEPEKIDVITDNSGKRIFKVIPADKLNKIEDKLNEIEELEDELKYR